MLERVRGNGQVRADLSAALSNGQLAHSLLLVGEEGCGTGFAARCLAADYLFPRGGSGADQVLASRSPECIEARGSGASGQISVETIREVRSKVADTALSAAGRAVIIYHAERMNPNSANALLKILEEPPADVLFILTAGSLAQVMPTIRSRCGIYTIAPVSQSDCAAALKGVSHEQARELAAIYDGHIGTCLEALSGHRRNSLAQARLLADHIAQGDEYSALALLAPYEKERAELTLLLKDLACLAAASLRQPGITPMTPNQAANAITQSGDAQDKLRRNISGRLVTTAFAARLFE